MTHLSCWLLYPQELEQCLAHNRDLINTSEKNKHLCQEQPVQRPWLDARSVAGEGLLREGGAS